MAQTGKLGTADSQLGNLLLAFVGVDPTPPSIDSQTGRLGSPLGDLMLALGGTLGPQVINLTAESVLTLSQSAVCDAEFEAQASPAWVFGGVDSQLGDFLLAFMGADDALPEIGPRSGRLGLSLGQIVLALGGTTDAQVINLSAESVLSLSQDASYETDFSAQDSPDWAFGGIDSQLGDLQPAFTGAGDPRPLTGTKTGKLGGVGSFLANVRLALGEEEGESAEGVINVSAESSLSLSQDVGYQAVFTRDVAHVLSLDHAVGLNRAVNVSADSTLALTSESGATSDTWVFELDADSTLGLTQQASATTGQWLYEVSAGNTLSLISSAEGVLGTIHNLSADSALALSHAAVGELGNVYEVSAENSLALSGLAVAVEGEWLHEETAENTLSLSQEASGGLILEATAENTLAITQEALGTAIHVYEVIAETTLALAQSCSTTKVVTLTASNAISLSHTLAVGRPWHLSAESILQETRWEFLPGTLELVEVTVGLDSSASVNTILNLEATSPIVLGQDVNFSFIEPGGILVSAENTLGLSQDAWNTQVGTATSALDLIQEATAQSGVPLGSALELEQSAGVSVVRSRSVESELELGQSVTHILVKQGAVELCDYAPTGGVLPDLQGPYPGVTSPFALIYPASGEPTDTIELHPPNLGNRDRLAFDRIHRESRGGTLTVFADPIWPKVQTRVLDFSALRQEEVDELIRFMQDHIGLEIKLSDWEQRVWKGIITTPDEPVIQDGKDSFSTTFEFEGELVAP